MGRPSQVPERALLSPPPALSPPYRQNLSVPISWASDDPNSVAQDIPARQPGCQWVWDGEGGGHPLHHSQTQSAGGHGNVHRNFTGESQPFQNQTLLSSSPFPTLPIPVKRLRQVQDSG
ncbi:hypothetical protein E2C01_085730 [Portunus trituberculatus]|uniref:Uncharacterized protein n=1 Tax=Portunus trituberculatus TaxID=210409 RepID=A0A5B7J8C8_PORTR|nr:hypothetical protein [Portunus trituberculatus]